MTRIIFLTIAATGLMANECAPVKASNACDDYVAYMCDCGSPDDCTDLTNLYDEPTQDEIDNCSLLLDQKQEEDATAGIECEIEEEEDTDV